jgi:hypothetical protein
MLSASVRFYGAKCQAAHKLHGIVPQKVLLLIVPTVGTSDLQNLYSDTEQLPLAQHYTAYKVNKACLQIPYCQLVLKMFVLKNITLNNGGGFLA